MKAQVDRRPRSRGPRERKRRKIIDFLTQFEIYKQHPKLHRVTLAFALHHENKVCILHLSCLHRPVTHKSYPGERMDEERSVYFQAGLTHKGAQISRP